jgi:hypothetical protein
MRLTTSDSRNERKNEQQAACHSQSSFRSREVVRELAVMGYSNKRVLGVRRPRMQLSFLLDCDDVALPAVKLDPDTELARVVPADVEVRQRAGLHDVECSCDDGFAYSVPPSVSPIRIA